MRLLHRFEALSSSGRAYRPAVSGRRRRLCAVAIVVVTAVAVTVVTWTTGRADVVAATTTPPHDHSGAPRTDRTATTRLGDDVVRYDFEQAEQALAGWSAVCTASLAIDDTVAHDGDHSLRVQPDPPSDRRYVEARVDVSDVAGDRPLRGARIVCQLRPGGTGQVPGVRAGLVVEDAATRADFGPDVALHDSADRGWVDLSLTVGRRNEPRVDGSTVYQAPRFNAKNVATLAIYVEAPLDGALTTAIRIDDCVIDGSTDTRSTARRKRTASRGRGHDQVYVPSLPPIDAVDRSPAAPAVGERQRGTDNPPADTRGPGDRRGGARGPDGGSGGGDPDSGADPGAPELPWRGEVLLHDFEDSDDIAVDGALLSIDDTTAIHGRRSLRLAPDPEDDRTSVEARVALADRLPDGVHDGARISCQLRPHAQVVAADAYASLIVDDARGASDHGAQTMLRDGGDWSEVSLVVGERGESTSNGGVAPQSNGFDSGSLTTLRVRIDASEPLTAAVNLDHCMITAG